ncbi:hypothetical protein Lal_00046143 [Lupinus albus]|uniref:Putative zinc/iron permease n=1 Tax=Lupinus albus TaxID=3870 RepID=A0A6A4PF49_LUPAL|nr:putative zinc/iron permease [Lupinus albus]KAF1886905.1 hypothetical protein Lal_00046143 [Lupinus albus]
MINSSCGSSELDLCRDESMAFFLKFVAMASILISGICGIAIPLFGKHRRFFSTDGNLFVAAKSFAAGVILATGFVHMLNDSYEALKDPCLESYVWSKFPFTGFFAMVSSLMTLLIDFMGTQYYEQKQRIKGQDFDANVDVNGDDYVSMESDGETGIVAGKVFGEEESGGMHIVGMRAHGSQHGHSHGGDDDESSVRHVIISQVLELGILSHSVIIGLSLGVSQSPCTIKPLIAALSFHQFFEGFALGGCISQAQFKTSSSTIMACFFALTTPIGVAIGTSIASVFNPYSPIALITEGILDSFSAGILMYMALVDLIAADFHSKTMRCNLRLQIISYCLLFLGAGLMSSLAIWA